MTEKTENKNLICPYCHNEARLTTGSEIYGPKFSDKVFWVCNRYPDCDSYVGCHPKTKRPLGNLANEELRTLRNQAHSLFDKLWQAKLARDRHQDGSKYTKGEARAAGYRWLAEKLGIKGQECHIGEMDVERCRQVIELCKPHFKQQG